MNNLPSQIDFAVDQEFVDNIGKDKTVNQQETFSLFAAIYYIFHLYKIINHIMRSDTALDTRELETMGLDYSDANRLSENITKEKHIYKFIYAIMLNKPDEVEDALNKETIDKDLLLSSTALFYFASVKWDVHNLTCLNIAAMLGRYEICRLLIKHGFDIRKMIVLYRIKAYGIPLSVNECLLMNALFRWYKSDKKKMEKPAAQELIDTIILASNKCPEIVNDEHLLEVGIRVQWYWTHIKDAIEDLELLKQLIPLNPNAMNEILNTGG